MDSYESRESGRRPRNRARERQVARQRRREVVSASLNPVAAALNRPAGDTDWKSRALTVTLDVFWHITHRPKIMLGIAAFFGFLFALFVASHLIAGRIFPNVWAFGVYLGDMTVDEAEQALLEAWTNDVQIALIVEGEKIGTVRPLELGMTIKARETAEEALSVGMAGIPFGYSVAPQAEVEYLSAQNYLLNVWETVHVLPFNAGFELRDGEIVGIEGRPGRELDVVFTLERLAQDPIAVAAQQRLDLVTFEVQPDVVDPTPLLADAQALINQQPEFMAYDPLKDERFSLSTSKEEFVRWLEAGATRLDLREEVFKNYIEAVNVTLQQTDERRYIDLEETSEVLRQAIAARANRVDLRIRYRQYTYTAESGDTGFRISRKTGMPFYLIREANPGIVWEQLSVGQVINIPSPDEILPRDPVPNKRIVVDLDRLHLTAYENGEVVFSWPVSSGRPTAPTSPGVYQILDHKELAIGSGVALCGANNVCGEWRMSWFMGIYEVSPGLINGFHGAVLLPNGAYLEGIGGGARTTYGCVMSDDGNAKKLYDWAEVGTMVEIISSEFEPRSQLARQALTQSA